MSSFLLLNGPNLNLLGSRQPDVYGRATLKDAENLAIETGANLGYDVVCLQSNHEGMLVDSIHAARGTHKGIILNAGAYTHTSVALLDAIAAVEVPTIELHLSNVHAREEFRHVSYISKAVIGSIMGFGIDGYRLSVEAMAQHLETVK